MPKLTENQMNFVYLGIAILIFIVFCVFAWFDSGEKDEVLAQAQKVQNEIVGALKAKSDIPKLNKELYTMYKSYELFKDYLPDQKKILEFYENLDKFRIQEDIGNLSYFKSKNKEIVEIGNDETDSKSAQPAKPTRGRTKATKQQFEEDNYLTSFTGTYDQIGKLLNRIENFDRFFSLNKLTIRTPVFAEKITFSVDLVINSYTYSGETPIEKQIENYVKKMKVTEDISKALKEIEESFKASRNFDWTKPDRDPFDKYAVLDPITTFEDTKNEQQKKIVFKLPDEKELNDILDKLRTNYNKFKIYAEGNKWLDLQNNIKESNYEEDLKVAIPSKYDNDGKIKKEIEKMKEDLKDWKIKIEKANREKKAMELINLATEKLKNMEEIYNLGKETANQAELKKVKDIYNSLYPMFKGMEDLEPNIPLLKEVRIKIEDYNVKADTQIRIIEMTKKFVLQGIIYIKNAPENSIAFVNQKVVKRTNELESGFIVDEIKPTLIILKYKEESVPLHLQKYKEKNKDKNKNKEIVKQG